MLIEVLIPEANHRYSFCKYLANCKRANKVVAVIEKCVVFRVRSCIYDDVVLDWAYYAGIPKESIGSVCYNDETLWWSKTLIDPSLRNYSWK